MYKRCTYTKLNWTCANKPYKNNLCRKHYTQNGGIIDLYCSVDNCENKKHGYGLCVGHLHRFQRQGENFDRVTPLKSFKISKKNQGNFPTDGNCLFINCINLIELKGLCEKHYKHIQRHKLDFNFAINEIKKGCFACGSFEKLSFDHDHNICQEKQVCEKCYRGILCRDCNMALGHLNDDINRIMSLKKYIDGRSIRVQ